MNSITAARWAALKAHAPTNGLVVEVVDPAYQACRFGVDEEGHLHLLIELGQEAVDVPQELEGVVVQVIETDRTFLDVYAKGHYEMIFTPMVNQMLSGVCIQGRKPIDAVIETIEEFRGPLKPLKPALTLSEQIGLLGEIWVLNSVLIPAIGSRACRLWSGPEFERHDFVGDTAHIEVKTTTRSEDKHEISRIDQLRAPADKQLLFASIQLERSEGGGMTLAVLIDDVVSALGTDGRAIDVFEAKLAKMGWHYGLRQSSQLKKFNLREAQFFLVEGSFPRLPDDYIPPRGITGIRYSIDVSARAVLDRV